MCSEKRKLKLIAILMLLSFNIISHAQEKFIGISQAIPPAIQKQMIGHSWHPGCPVPLNQLAYLQLSYWGYDQKPHQGVLIVHKTLAHEVIDIFHLLYRHHFPIQEMKLYDDYPDGEYAKHNDTVGFYCRPAQDVPSEYSSHSYGIAIDINPLVNPYADFIAKKTWPIEGTPYMNRALKTPGMIHANDLVFNTFTEYGWEWGGLETKGTDYMHFRKKITAHYRVIKMIYRVSNTNPALPKQ